MNHNKSINWKSFPKSPEEVTKLFSSFQSVVLIRVPEMSSESNVQGEMYGMIWSPDQDYDSMYFDGAYYCDYHESHHHCEILTEQGFEDRKKHHNEMKNMGIKTGILEGINISDISEYSLISYITICNVDEEQISNLLT